MKMLLERGYRVAIFDVVLPSIPMDNVHSIQGDIRNSVAFHKALRETKAEIVFHTAAIVDLRPIPSQQMYLVNVEGTRVVVEQCRKSKHCKTLVNTSSIEVVAGILSNGKEQIPNGCDETVQIPEHHFLKYGATKAVAEKLVLEADETEGALQTCSIRPGYIVGNHCTGHQIAMRIAVEHHNYDVDLRVRAKISCVNPKSAAALHILAAEKIKDSHGQSMFAGDFEMNDTELKKYAFQDTDVTFVFLPFWIVFIVMWILDRWERGMHFLFNLCGCTRTTSRNVFDIGVLKMTTSDTTISSKKARDLLGWKPLVSQKQTMIEARNSAQRYWKTLVHPK